MSDTRAVRQAIGQTLDKAIIDSAPTPNYEYGRLGNAIADKEFPSVESNILKLYQSYTYRWVLAALTPEQLESGSYRNGDISPGSIVLAEGGYTGPRPSAVRTDSGNEPDDLRSQTFYGSPEFFINNIEIKIIAGMNGAAGGSGNFVCKFEVYEPHSLGLFLQSIQAAAQRAGFGLNYVQCPFMLRCDFLGWQTGRGITDVVTTGKSEITSRYFVINIREIKFTANETGSVYQVNAIHKDNSAFSNINDSPITESTKVLGRTVREILRQGETSLQVVLNAARKKLKDKALDAQPDEYEIDFAEDLFGNERFNSPQGQIGDSKFSKSMADPPSALSGSEADSTESGSIDRSKIQLVNGVGSFQFNSGQSVTEMITEIMLHSDYATKAFENIDKNTGMVSWFRISSNVTFKKNKADPVKNRLQKVIKYIVTPYKIHHSLFKHPSVKAVGYETLKKTIKRKYDYLFTGQNDDILKWELKFDGSWYTAMDPSGLENTGAKDSSRAASVEEVEAKRIRIALDQGRTGSVQEQRITDTYRLEFDRKNVLDLPYGGAYSDNAAVKAARQFQKAALESKDLMRIQLEITGDPYYMAESGSLDKSMIPSVANPYVTDTGVMTSEVTEIRTFVRFKTPIDVPSYGSLYEFPQNGRIYSPFSGLYRIIFVTHMFRDGQFTQILDMIRDRDQPLSDELRSAVTDQNIEIYESKFTVDPSAKASANDGNNN